MKPHYDILGKSSFAIAVIFDILHQLHPEGCTATIVTNIPDAENSSLQWDFATTGIEHTCIESDAYRRDPNTPKILGSIGKARHAIVRHFAERHQVRDEEYLSLIHPSAVIGQEVKIGFGAHIGPGVSIAPFAVISCFCVVNRNSSVGHHTTLNAFACLNPGVHVAGICRIEEHVTIGMSAAVVDGLNIGSHSIIGAGSVVTRNIPPGVIAYGVPAKVIREVSSR